MGWETITGVQGYQSSQGLKAKLCEKTEAQRSDPITWQSSLEAWAKFLNCRGQGPRSQMQNKIQFSAISLTGDKN